MTAALATFLRRCGCHVEITSAGALDVTAPQPDTISAALRQEEVELAAYLHVWAALHPDAPAELVPENAAR